MAAITDYTTLVAAVQDWAERSDFDADEIIGLAEADFRIEFGPNFALETAGTTLTFTAGSAALPAGFIRPLALTHSVYGPLTSATIGRIRERRVWDSSGIPDIYAVTGTTILVAPSYVGDLTLDYEGSLVGLTSGNPTNWLVTNAPQAYLSMCKSYVAARGEDYGQAATLSAKASGTLNALGIQSMVAQINRASVRIPGATP
jgi:hypothetical protein